MKILIFLITLMALSCSSETNKQRYLPVPGPVGLTIMDSYTGEIFLLLDEDNKYDRTMYGNYYWAKTEFTPDKVSVIQTK